MVDSTWSIARRIADRASANPGSPALTVDGETWTYGELVNAALALGATWPTAREHEAPPVTAVIAQRHASSYLGILAALLRGHTYVPVNIEHPDQRNLSVLRKSRAQRLVHAPGAAAETLLSKAGRLESVRCGDRKSDHETSGHVGELPPARVPADRRVYMLFTSGSTGEPKGVPISHGNLTAYLDAASGMVVIAPGDRLSQTFELTFDPSVHDMMMCWIHGAHLVVPTSSDLARPANYIRDRKLTHWFSVPSLGYQMRLQGDLKPASFPLLQSSLFCGEALPAALADEWAAAAPNGNVENWYGPTEATIVCARHVLPKPDGNPPQFDLVPLGEAFPGMRLTIHAEDLSFAPDGTPGELYLSGTQVAQGYLDDPERSARAFIRLPGETGVFYRTGDLVVREADGPVRYLNRIDNQVKVRGFRIELGEIESVLRSAAGGVNAIALSWPPGEPSGRFIVAALEATFADTAAVLAEAAKSLPDYMIPARIVCLPAFPRNASGKTDRKAIARQVEILLGDTASDPLPDLTAPAQRLMDAIRAVAPTVSPHRVLESPSLMSAGMDSLSFISLTAEIERQYDRTLSQDQVVDLSLLSFKDMVAWLEGGGKKPAAATGGRLERVLKPLRRMLGLANGGPAANQGLNHRTNRSLQFIRRFPAVLAGAKQPLVLFIGSSGVFRGLSPADFEAEARRAGHSVLCLNVGLPAISNAGMKRLAAYISECCERAGMRLAIAVYEFDPTRMSVLPVNYELDLPEGFFSGAVQPFADGALKPEFEWSAEAQGTWIHDEVTTKGKRRPNWEKDRDYEVARTYAGSIEFVPSKVRIWSDSIAAISAVADRTLCFVHPINRAMMDQLGAEHRGERFDTLLRQIAATPGVETIPWQHFELTDADFLDLNHLNPMSGRPALSAQLARWIFR
jgi:amino acid adenylation domain-containing protein